MNIDYIKKQILKGNISQYVIKVGYNNPEKVQRFLLDNGIKWNNSTKWEYTKNITYFILFPYYANNSSEVRMILSISKNYNILESDNIGFINYSELNNDKKYINFIDNLFKDIL